MAAAWDGEDGEHWLTWAELYDRAVSRHHDPLLATARIGSADRVLDVGCGNGQTTRDAARRAAGGLAVGIDLSARLLDNARRLATEEGVANATFVQGDAQVHPFASASFDVVISRTGTMFFGDPVAAFANIAGALRPHGRLAMLVWQAPTANEWITEIFRILTAGRSPTPPPPAGAPGPFSLADPDVVRATLTGAGFADIRVEGHAAPMYFGASGDEAFRFLSSLGLVRSSLEAVGRDDRCAVLDGLCESVAAHETTGGVHYDSAAWIVSAEKPAEGEER
jgi:SAM-dependent methyltransferase